MIKIVKHLTLMYRTLIFITFSTVSTAYATNGIDRSWQFKVYLDGDEIGFHNFSIVHSDEQHKVHSHEIYSKAQFDVKFLFINAYSYRHDNIERWSGQCLDSINAVTDDNGELYKISGKVIDNAFVINTAEQNNEYSPCIKSFAYWDKDFLNETYLLNSQTGEMIKVSSEFIGNDTIRHMGEEINARHYRLRGENLQIDLWYSYDDHWLALESLTESGRVVRYEVP